MASNVVVISPVRAYVTPMANWEYYDIPSEFPNDPLKTLLRWVNYPWAYGTQMVPTQLPPD